MEVTGKIRVVMPANSGVSQRTGNTWMSQDYVMDYFWWPNQTQPSQMMFRVFGEDRIKQWNMQVNDEVRITYHIEAHEYDGRWFNEVQCTNVQKVGASANTEEVSGQSAEGPTAPAGATVPPLPESGQQQEGGEDDDLPF